MSQSSLICLIHGHGVDASIWDGVYADLALDHTVIKPDFSRNTQLSTIEQYAEELHNQLPLTSGQKIILVGHSMGGYMALAFAEQYPNLVQGLVLYHSTATADDDAKRKARQDVMADLQRQGTAPFIDKQMPKMVAPDFPADETAKLVNQYQSLPAEALIAGLKAIAGRPDRTQVLQQASFPVLLVLGRQDQLIPYDKTAELAHLSTQISIAPIEQAGHLSMIEQPAVSVRILRGFIDPC